MANERIRVIPEIAKQMEAKRYLEIGCRYDEVFGPVSKIVPECVGVDPKSGGNIQLTSDRFFRALDCNQLVGVFEQISIHQIAQMPDPGLATETGWILIPSDRFDLIFIDGDHRADQVQKDLNNSLRYLNEGGTILLHDTMPGNKGQTAHNVCGTVWKVAVASQTIATLDMRTLALDFGITAIRERVEERCPPFEFEFPVDWEKFEADKLSFLRATDSVDDFIRFAIGK